MLVSTGSLLHHLCQRRGAASRQQQPGPQQSGQSRRHPVIFVSATGGQARWIVPRLNFLTKSHMFGPFLVFESVADGGIREAAEKLRDFIRDVIPQDDDAPKSESTDSTDASPFMSLFLRVDVPFCRPDGSMAEFVMSIRIQRFCMN